MTIIYSDGNSVAVGLFGVKFTGNALPVDVVLHAEIHCKNVYRDGLVAQ